MEQLGDSCLDHVAQNKVLKFHVPCSTPQKNNRFAKIWRRRQQQRV
jgi:hypothetical protein